MLLPCDQVILVQHVLVNAFALLRTAAARSMRLQIRRRRQISVRLNRSLNTIHSAKLLPLWDSIHQFETKIIFSFSTNLSTSLREIGTCCSFTCICSASRAAALFAFRTASLFRRIGALRRLGFRSLGMPFTNVMFGADGASGAAEEGDGTSTCDTADATFFILGVLSTLSLLLPEWGGVDGTAAPAG